FFSSLIPPPPRSTLFPYTTLFRSGADGVLRRRLQAAGGGRQHAEAPRAGWSLRDHRPAWHAAGGGDARVPRGEPCPAALSVPGLDRKSTRLNSSHDQISYAVFCLK